MPGSLERVSGLETTRTLVGAVDLPRFSITGLARHSGVPRRTVDTVCRRYQSLFEQVGSERSGRGRPAIQWRLKQDRVGEVLRLVDRLQRSLSVTEQNALRSLPDEQVARALVIDAATSLAQAAVSAEVDAHRLVRAARYALEAAGFQAEGPLPDTLSSDDGLATTAAFTDSVASLFEAIRNGQQDDIDSARSKALTLGQKAAPYMTAEQWQPLVQLMTRAFDGLRSEDTTKPGNLASEQVDKIVSVTVGEPTGTSEKDQEVSAGDISASAHGVLYVHSVPPALCPHVEWVVAGILGMPVSLAWTPQPALSTALRANCHWHGEPGIASRIASAMRGWSMIRFEVTEEPSPGNDGERYAYTPPLGLFHSQMRTNGDVLVGEGQLRALLHAAREGMIRAADLGRALGVPWDEELEVYRRAGGGGLIGSVHQVG